MGETKKSGSTESRVRKGVEGGEEERERKWREEVKGERGRGVEGERKEGVRGRGRKAGGERDK